MRHFFVAFQKETLTLGKISVARKNNAEAEEACRRGKLIKVSVNKFK
jgi:hypothetical protein